MISGRIRRVRKHIGLKAAFLFAAALMCGSLMGKQEDFPGERLTFHFSAKKAGFPVLKSSLSIETQGDLYLLTSTFISTGILRPFFRMDNQFRSFVKREGLDPLRYEKIVDQKGFLSKALRYIDILTFDGNAGKVKIERIDPPHVREVSVPASTYDPLTMFLRYLLDADMRSRQNIVLRIFDGNRISTITFVSEKEDLTSPLLGRIEAIGLEAHVPIPRLGNRRGLIKIWYTDDERIFPVRIVLDLPSLGRTTFELDAFDIEARD